MDAFVVIEVDVIVNHLVGFLKSFRLVSVDTLCFEDSKEIFSQGIVIAISTP